MRFLDDEQRQQIGYSFIIDNLELITPYGIKEKKNIKPYTINQREKLIEELNKLEEIIQLEKEKPQVINDIKYCFMKFKDIGTTVNRCLNGEILDEVELFEIKTFVLLTQELIEKIRELNTSIKEFKLEPTLEVLDLLDPQNRRLNAFYIYEEYSKTLRTIRDKKRELEKNIYATKDIEEIEELKELRLEIVVQESEEEFKVRKKLSSFIQKHINHINHNVENISQIDMLLAKGSLVKKYGGIKPDIVEKKELLIEDAYNPEIVEVLNSKNAEFTPVSIMLKNGTSIITGANMGGKTITLKTITLNIFLVQCGFFAFCKKISMPIMDFIYFISDDMQSISKGLSTFGAEIIKLREVVEATKRGNGFIALDEFARGTNPKEGRYLVKSVALFLQKFKSITLISTHYDGVVQEGMEHYQVIGLKNIDFDSLKRKIDLNKTSSIGIIQKHMDYRLEKVINVDEAPKDALNISILLGLDKEIVDIIKNFYNREENNEE